MSSQRAERRKAHDDKVVFATLDEAWSALRSIRRNHPDWGLMRPYRCPWGQHFHVGHPPRQRKHKRRKRR